MKFAQSMTRVIWFWCLLGKVEQEIAKFVEIIKVPKFLRIKNVHLKK